MRAFVRCTVNRPQSALLVCITGKSINQAACDLAHEVASEGDALTLEESPRPHPT